MSEPPLTERVLGSLRSALSKLEPWAEKQWIGITLGAVTITLVAGALIFVRTRGDGTEPHEGTAPPLAATPPAPAPSHPSTPSERAPTPPTPGATPAAPEALAAPAPSAEAADAGAPLSPNVKVTFKTYPGRRASVMWGGKRLGFIDRNKPLVVERPRDSGPLDVVIRSPGFVAVHVRAYTVVDNVVDVKITPNDKKDTIYGYKQPLPPEPDAGAP